MLLSLVSKRVILILQSVASCVCYEFDFQYFTIVQFFRIFVLELKSGRGEIDSKFDKDISRRSASAL